MRIVAWNCNMALHRKLEALLRLRPDIAIVSECAMPQRLREKLEPWPLEGEPVWVGTQRDKGLAVLAFNGWRARLAPGHRATLHHIAPVRIEGGGTAFNLLAVWAQNFSGGIRRKHQLGPLRLALSHYRAFLGEGPTVVAGDFNNNVYWDRPGYRRNHAAAVAILERYGLVSAYHAAHGEAQGAESAPTLYWRDRLKDGPTYHIDYVFVPQTWVAGLRHVEVGTFEDWCGTRLSDHVPVLVEIDVRRAA